MAMVCVVEGAMWVREAGRWEGGGRMEHGGCWQTLEGGKDRDGIGAGVNGGMENVGGFDKGVEVFGGDMFRLCRLCRGGKVLEGERGGLGAELEGNWKV